MFSLWCKYFAIWREIFAQTKIFNGESVFGTYGVKFSPGDSVRHIARSFRADGKVFTWIERLPRYGAIGGGDTGCGKWDYRGEQMWEV